MKLLNKMAIKKMGLAKGLELLPDVIGKLPPRFYLSPYALQIGATSPNGKPSIPQVVDLLRPENYLLVYNQSGTFYLDLNQIQGAIANPDVFESYTSADVDLKNFIPVKHNKFLINYSLRRGTLAVKVPYTLLDLDTTNCVKFNMKLGRTEKRPVYCGYIPGTDNLRLVANNADGSYEVYFISSEYYDKYAWVVPDTIDTESPRFEITDIRVLEVLGVDGPLVMVRREIPEGALTVDMSIGKVILYNAYDSAEEVDGEELQLKQHTLTINTIEEDDQSTDYLYMFTSAPGVYYTCELPLFDDDEEVPTDEETTFEEDNDSPDEEAEVSEASDEVEFDGVIDCSTNCGEPGHVSAMAVEIKDAVTETPWPEDGEEVMDEVEEEVVAGDEEDDSEEEEAVVADQLEISVGDASLISELLDVFPDSPTVSNCARARCLACGSDKYTMLVSLVDYTSHCANCGYAKQPAELLEALLKQKESEALPKTETVVVAGVTTEGVSATNSALKS